ncbi:uncharacterized protein LOC106651733, partial [Trichogramma pretiosum]|uniref:uncharacterized protein LOC106651733 n=1 Tax=Trichogramma pretiosum TaxID=7493 RepID=UPI000C71AC81
MIEDAPLPAAGSPADSAENLEIGDEILEVNGRTLENASHSEILGHIHECIKSRTICLRVRRRSGNKMILDSPGTKGIEDAWVIAVERSARERLQKLTELRRIKPRDIQAILHQQITEGSIASTSEEATDKDVTSSQITVTLADKEGSTTTAYVTKLSNGTVNNQGIVKDSTQDPRANQLRKQTSSLEDPDLVFSPVLQVVGGVRNAERRASSPFQNGRTEVLIGEPEGGPRSPRGSTSSAVNEEHDYPEPII